MESRQVTNGDDIFGEDLAPYPWMMLAESLPTMESRSDAFLWNTRSEAFHGQAQTWLYCLPLA